MEDKDIIALYLERNEEAIAETEKKYGKYCYSVAYNILYNAEDAKECVNDALMNAWNSIPPHMPSVLSAFLGKLTRYVSLKKWRYARTKKRGGGETAFAYEELSDCIPGSKSVEEELQEKELAEIIDHFLDELPVTERRIFICRYWYFDDISTISRQFGFSGSKVKSMLYRTRKKLLFRLNEKGVYK